MFGVALGVLTQAIILTKYKKNFIIHEYKITKQKEHKMEKFNQESLNNKEQIEQESESDQEARKEYERAVSNGYMIVDPDTFDKLESDYDAERRTQKIETEKRIHRETHTPLNMMRGLPLYYESLKRQYMGRHRNDDAFQRRIEEDAVRSAANDTEWAMNADYYSKSREIRNRLIRYKARKLGREILEKLGINRENDDNEIKAHSSSESK